MTRTLEQSCLVAMQAEANVTEQWQSIIGKHGEEKLFKWLLDPDQSLTLDSLAAKTGNLFTLTETLSAQSLIDLYFLSCQNEKIDEDWTWTIRDRVTDSITPAFERISYSERYRFFVHIVYREQPGVDGWEKYKLLSCVDKLVVPYLTPLLRSALENTRAAWSEHGNGERYLSNIKDVIAAQERLKI